MEELAMSTGLKFKAAAGVVVLCAAVLCPGIVCAARAASSQSQGHHKTKKPAPVPLPPLPSGPTGPVQPIPLDSIAPVPPQVTYQNEQLTIVAPNSTLGDILRAVRKQTGAEIEIPAAPDRVVTHLGPGPARAVVAELLNGSRFNYVLLGSPANDALLTRVVLVPKTGPDLSSANGSSLAEQQPGNVPPNMAQPNATADANEAEATDDNTDDAADQAAAEAEQPATPEQPGVKTPQEMLQEMQQRQMQLQQQQQPMVQPGMPGTVMPPRPPQEQQ